MRALLLLVLVGGLVAVSAFSASLAIGQVARVGGVPDPVVLRTAPCRAVGVQINRNTSNQVTGVQALVRCSYAPPPTDVFGSTGALALCADVAMQGNICEDFNGQGRRKFDHNTTLWSSLSVPSPYPALGTRWRVRVRLGPTDF